VRVAERAPHAHIFIVVANLPVNEIDRWLNFIAFERPSQTLRSNVKLKLKRAEMRMSSYLFDGFSFLLQT
jgi:hypothetical protein